MIGSGIESEMRKTLDAEFGASEQISKKGVQILECRGKI